MIQLAQLSLLAIALITIALVLSVILEAGLWLIIILGLADIIWAIILYSEWKYLRENI